jgi:hypothetical protein
MPTRTIVLTALIASCVSSLVTLTVALLVLAPGIRAAPDPQTVQPVVRAERFELMDDNGQIRAVLGRQHGAPDVDGLIGLVVFGADGVRRLVIALSPTGDRPFMALAERPGPARAMMGMYPDGSAAMRWTDETGQPRAVFGVAPDGAANVAVGNPLGMGVQLSAQDTARPNTPLGVPGAGVFIIDAGVPRGSLHLTPDRAPLLNLADASGQPRLRMGVPPDGRTTIRLTDERDQLVWQAP